jgi:hypothetical protein
MWVRLPVRFWIKETRNTYSFMLRLNKNLPFVLNEPTIKNNSKIPDYDLEANDYLITRRVESVSQRSDPRYL